MDHQLHGKWTRSCSQMQSTVVEQKQEQYAQYLVQHLQVSVDRQVSVMYAFVEGQQPLYHEKSRDVEFDAVRENMGVYCAHARD